MQLGLQPGDVGLDVITKQPAGMMQTVLFGSQHLAKLASSGQDVLECLGLRVRQHARLRMDRRREVSQHPGVNGIGLRQFAGAFRIVSGVLGIHHCGRYAGFAQGGRKRDPYPPVASITTRTGPIPLTYPTTSLIPASVLANRLVPLRE